MTRCMRMMCGVYEAGDFHDETDAAGVRCQLQVLQYNSALLSSADYVNFLINNLRI